MTTTTVIVQNIPSSTVNVEADVGYGGAMRPASAAHMKVSNDDVSATNPVPVALPEGPASAFFDRVSSSGVVASGCYNVTFANIGSGDASIISKALPPGAVVTFHAPSGMTLGDVTYDATGTTLIISGAN